MELALDPLSMLPFGFLLGDVTSGAEVTPVVGLLLLPLLAMLRLLPPAAVVLLMLPLASSGLGFVLMMGPPL